MNPKILCITGLTFLIISQILFSLGFDFLQAQKPIDFAHWFMLIGAVLLLSFNKVFPKSIFNTIAIFLTILGVIAHIGMCTIDFLLWAYGEDHDGRNQLISHIMNTPSVRYPFMIIGPSLLYAGLTTHAWKFIFSHPIRAVMTMIGSAIIGLGQFMWDNRLLVVIGYIVFATGLTLLLYRKEKPAIN